MNNRILKILTNKTENKINPFLAFIFECRFDNDDDHLMKFRIIE